MAIQQKFENFRLWTKNTGPDSSGRCLISSHGEDAKSSFNLTSGKVVFYVPPGASYTGESQAALLDILNIQKLSYRQSIISGLCPDYKLYKLQEYHSDTMGGPLQFINKAAHKIKGLQVDESINDVNNLVDTFAKGTNPIGTVDIVTIRFRPFKKACRLSEIVGQLSLLGYTEFHCAFCR